MAMTSGRHRRSIAEAEDISSFDSYGRDLIFACRDRERFTGGFPFYRQPRQIGCYSVDGNRKFHHDDRNRKFYSPPKKKDFRFNLSADYDKTVKRSVADDEKLDTLLRWIAANLETLVQNVKCEKGDKPSLLTDFVCFRGLLTKLLCTPYENREGWIVCATRFNGTVYLCNIDTDEDTRRKANLTPREELMTSWGYKFESYVTSATPGGVVNICDPVNENEEFCVVFRTRLEQHSIITGAEVDCVDHDSGKSSSPPPYMELKTSRQFSSDRQYQNFQKFKLHKWWAQSFLAGIPKIVCGFRDDNGVVRSLQPYETAELPKLAKGMWDAAVCFNFCKEFLAFVKQSVLVDDPFVVYKFEWKPGADVRGSRHLRHAKYQILPDWYIERWKSIQSDV